MGEKQEMPPLKLELLPLPNNMRRRSKSDVSQYKGAVRRNSCHIPEIQVEDCSDKKFLSDDEELDELPPLGAFRSRSNTCPNDLFHQRSPRPATPPPLEGKKLTWKELSRNPSKEKVSFAPHKLSKVTEDNETDKVDKYQNKEKILMYTTSKLSNVNIRDTSSARSSSRTIGVTECG